MDVLLKAPAVSGSALAGMRLIGSSINPETGAVVFVGKGVFRDDDAEKIVRDAFFDDKSILAIVSAPDLWEFTGQMFIESLEYDGEHGSEPAFLIAIRTDRPQGRIGE
jgi:predicted secreted protein